MLRVPISNRLVGENEPVFIIVEIGSNYNQDFSTAARMIDIAQEAGADAIKFQIFQEKRLYPPNAGKVDYLQKDVPINTLVKMAEVPNPMHQKLMDYCLQKGTLYLCTPTDQDVADYLQSIDVPAFKVASYALTHLPLLRHIARKGKPMILSTGASHFHEIAEAVAAIREEGNDQIILLQCVARYPAEPFHANLRVMDLMRSAFDVPVGYSDHSIDPFVVPYAAVARGASVLEKHFTLERKQEGPDHAFALEPTELRAMIKGIRAVQDSMGNGVKKVEPWEYELRQFTYRSIFATTQIHRGDRLSLDNLDCLRPGKKQSGIPARFLEIILGAKALREVPAGTALQWGDVLEK